MQSWEAKAPEPLGRRCGYAACDVLPSSTAEFATKLQGKCHAGLPEPMSTASQPL